MFPLDGIKKMIAAIAIISIIFLLFGEKIFELYAKALGPTMIFTGLLIIISLVWSDRVLAYIISYMKDFTFGVRWYDHYFMGLEKRNKNK